MNIKRELLGITDEVFKDVFSNHPDLLVGYVNKICGLNLNPEKTECKPLEAKRSVNGRRAIFDVRYESSEEDSVVHINMEAQKIRPQEDKFRRREFFYVSNLYSEAYKEGDSFSKNVKVREIVFITKEYNFSGSPIKIIKYHNIRDKIYYDDIIIYEIYIDKLIEVSQNGLTKLNEYDKMILEMVEVFKTNDLDKYTKSQNSLVSEVAKVIREYTEEEIEKMIRRIEKEDEDDYQSVIDEAKIEARRIGMAEGLAEGRAEGRTQGLAEGRTQGLAEGRAEGRVEGLEDNIKTMYNNGLSIEDISKFLSLDINYVKKVLSK